MIDVKVTKKTSRRLPVVLQNCYWNVRKFKKIKIVHIIKHVPRIISFTDVNVHRRGFNPQPWWVNTLFWGHCYPPLGVFLFWITPWHQVCSSQWYFTTFTTRYQTINVYNFFIFFKPVLSSLMVWFLMLFLMNSYDLQKHHKRAPQTKLLNLNSACLFTLPCFRNCFCCCCSERESWWRHFSLASVWNRTKPPTMSVKRWPLTCLWIDHFHLFVDFLGQIIR